jgi:hypothetical protein
MNQLVSTLLLLFISNLSIYSQQSISGKIIDSKTNSPVGRAVIALVYTDEKQAFQTAFTDFEGKYQIAINPKKDFYFKVQMMGYANFERKISISNIPNLLNVKLVNTQTKIKEVEIEGTRARATIKDDTIIYDAKAFKTHKDANVEDLVKKMPGITTEGGTLKAQGEEVRKITVDGQEFFGDDVNVALRNLPAETIDKVEVFDGQSDRASFTGFNDGNTTKTINLKTKAGMKHGYFGKVYGGGGTESTFQGGGNMNYFDGDKRVSILGLANNINNLNFSTSEIIGAVSGSSGMGGMQGRSMMRNMGFGMRVAGGNRGGGGFSNFSVSNQDGVNSAYSFGANYVDRWGKNRNTKLSSSIFTNRTDNVYNEIMNSRNFVNEGNTLFTNGNTNREQTLFNTRFNSRMETYLDANNSIVWTNALNISESNSYSNSKIVNTFQNNTRAFENNQISDNASQNVSFSTNFLYRLKLKKSGRTFSFNPIFDITRQNGTSIQQNNSTTSVGTSQFELNNNSTQWSNTVSAVFSYTEPSGKFGQWLLTYSPSIAYKRNEVINTYSEVFGTPGDIDSNLSNILQNPIFYNTGGVSYRLQFSKWRFMFGTNVQNINFSAQNNVYNTSAISQEFFGILPHFNIQFQPQKMFKIRLNYTTSMNTPSASNIQPLTDISNPQSIFRGNPNLKAEYNHNLFFHFIKPNLVKGTFLFFMTNMNYTQNKNASSNFTALNDTTIGNLLIRKGVQYNTIVNLDGQFNGMIFGNYTTPLKWIKSNLSFNSSVNYNRSPTLVNNIENISNNWTLSNGAMLSSNISEDVDFSLGYNPKYIINTYSQFKNLENNFWIHSLTSNLKITFLKHFVFNSDFSYNYNSQIDPNLNQHVFLLGSSVAYKMLKKRDLEIKFSVFDLFDQNRNISRNVNENMITDTRINALNRYFMLTATYNFKKFKSGGDRDEQNPMFRMMH